MFQKKHYILLLLLLSLSFSNTIASQVPEDANIEIRKLANQATELMINEKYEKSLVVSRIALTKAIDINDDLLIARCYNIIAANFDGIAEFEKAYFYYKKGLIYADRTDNDELKNWLYNNLGNIYCFDKKEYVTGIYYYKKSLEYSTKIGDSAQLVFTNLNIAWAYFDIGNYEKGYPYLQYINKYHSKYGDQTTVVALNMLNGMYYSHQNNNQKATTFFKTAIKLGIAEDEKSDLSFSYQEYSRFLLKNGDYKNAYINLCKFNSLTTEINNEEKIKKANIAGINLEIDEYKREIDDIEDKYKTKEQVLIEKQSKNKRISTIIIALLLFIIIIFYFFTQNIRLKQKNKLKDVQTKIQENIYNASVNGQEIERKKIAAFLHDDISAILSSAGLHLSVFTSKNAITSEEITKTRSLLKEAHDKVRDLSHQLIPSLLARFGLYFSLKDLCEKNSNSVIQFKYSSSVDDKTRYKDAFEMKIYFIIAELFNNIIKHSEATLAQINIEEKEGKLIIHIEDNGKGFNNVKFNSKDGFGLNQIRARINNIHGEIKIISSENNGTKIKIKTPIIYKS
ncbi:signal transduction histidine kinase [Flavobacterium sp. 7E]|uniref:tetratricopeptide repeat-containing sensor histidine kinase n=1 Tax=Flavobacterium sp. 7E TaxID=2735898 RepID=UPI00156FD3DD|nr:tetratricopeptide repeat-containing sensor histidine kinase [Flavobacterium sp. 7E]NRS88183.1 signal transduction histidine kinase [Flavobacterium sp. 7E]